MHYWLMLNTLIGFSDAKDKIEIVVDPGRLRPIDADLQVPNTSKFRDHTGWKPQYDFETTMYELLQYWRDRISNDEQFLTR